MGQMENAYKILVENPEEKSHKRTCEDNIKTDIKVIWFEV
jgi:hypothetical protein